MLVVTHAVSFTRDVSRKAVLLDEGEIEEGATSVAFFIRPRRIGRI